MSVVIKKDSRLRFCELRTVDGISFWDVPEYPEILEQPDDVLYTVQGSDRLDNLAHRFYKSSRLKWVIMVANGLELEPSDISEGDVLRIPSPRYVLNVLFGTAVV